MRSTGQLLEALGGRDVVAELTHTRRRTVDAWVRIGVPHKHFDLLVAYAKAHSIRGISIETLYAAKQASLREAAE